MRIVLAILVLVLLAIGSANASSTRHAAPAYVVVLKGKPVPAGYISFMPDATAGNLGQVKVAQIRDGLYDTAMETNPGIFPGGTIIRIAGFDGKKAVARKQSGQRASENALLPQ